MPWFGQMHNVRLLLSFILFAAPICSAFAQDITVVRKPDDIYDKDGRPVKQEIIERAPIKPGGLFVSISDDKPGEGGWPKADTAEQNSAVKSTCAGAKGGNAMSPRPVILATGEKIKFEQDWLSNSEAPLSGERIYRSKLAVGQLFGSNWISALEIPLLSFSAAACIPVKAGVCVPQSVVYTDSSGAKYTYQRGAYEPGTNEQAYVGRDGTFIVYEFGQNWSLYKNKRFYNYSVAGRIQSVGDVSGADSKTYTYSPCPYT